MKLLSIDYGERRIGVAVSDETGTFAFPNCVLENDEKVVMKIHDLVDQKKIDKIIFGLSKDQQGKDNPIMENARKLSIEVERTTGKEIVFQDESFSSFHAHNEKFAVTDENTNKNIDASAAAIILQRYIDTNKDKN